MLNKWNFPEKERKKAAKIQVTIRRINFHPIKIDIIKINAWKFNRIVSFEYKRALNGILSMNLHFNSIRLSLKCVRIGAWILLCKKFMFQPSADIFFYFGIDNSIEGVNILSFWQFTAEMYWQWEKNDFIWNTQQYAYFWEPFQASIFLFLKRLEFLDRF